MIYFEMHTLKSNNKTLIIKYLNVIYHIIKMIKIYYYYYYL